MPIPDACLSSNYPNGAGPGSPGDGDGSTTPGPGGPPGNENNTGPTDGPLSNYQPGYGSATAGWPQIMLTAEMRKDIYLQLNDGYCTDVASDLTGIDHIEFVAKEWLSAPEIYLRKDCIIADAAKGLIRIRFKPSNIPFAGIWPSAVVGYNADNEVIAQYKCYLYIQPNINLVGSNRLHNYPLQIHEVRLAMRDVCPEFNTLLEDVEFSDMELMYTMQRPINEWNETSPDLGDNGYSFTQNTFPWREHWLRATVGYLLQSGAIHQQRNNFNYSAGGLTIKDKDKATPYLGIADRLLSEWREWLLLKKREINIQLCYGSINSISFGYPFNYTDRTW